MVAVKNKVNKKKVHEKKGTSEGNGKKKFSNKCGISNNDKSNNKQRNAIMAKTRHQIRRWETDTRKWGKKKSEHDKAYTMTVEQRTNKRKKKKNHHTLQSIRVLARTLSVSA